LSTQSQQLKQEQQQQPLSLHSFVGYQLLRNNHPVVLLKNDDDDNDNNNHDNCSSNTHKNEPNQIDNDDDDDSQSAKKVTATADADADAAVVALHRDLTLQRLGQIEWWWEDPNPSMQSFQLTNHMLEPIVAHCLK
jgi:hypothetical protein